MPSVVLLSEINPASALLFDQQLNPVTQTRDWYPELFATIQSSPAAADLADAVHFQAFIKSLYEAVRTAERTLVLRDYNYIDYFGVPFKKATCSSSLLEALGDAFKVKSAVLVRHPLRQYDSLRSHRSAGTVLSPQIYLEGYSTFLEDFASSYFIKYEDIIEDPYKSIVALCRFLGLTYPNDFLERFPEYYSVTGNLARQEDPTISHSLWEPDGDEWRAQLLEHPSYHALLERLGYADDETARGPALPATPANTPERITARLAASDRTIRSLKATIDSQLDDINNLRANNDRLRLHETEAQAREALLNQNNAALRQLFDDIRERDLQIGELSAALDEARGGWSAASDQGELLQRALDAERAAAGERLELLEAATADNELLRTLAIESQARERRHITELSAALEAERAAASERLELLEAAKAENERLRTAATERLELLERLTAEVERQIQLSTERA